MGTPTGQTAFSRVNGTPSNGYGYGRSMYTLPDCCGFVDSLKLSSLIHSSNSNTNSSLSISSSTLDSSSSSSSDNIPETANLPSLLIIDTRPFHEYRNGHIKGAINLCLPSTLLKRKSFGLFKCIQEFTDFDKLLMERYLGLVENDDGSLALDSSLDDENVAPLPLLVLYDGKSDGSVNGNGNVGWGLCCLAEKFVGSDDVPGWGKGKSKGKGNGEELDQDQGMFVLNGGFQEFIKSYPALVESGCSSISSTSDSDSSTSTSSSSNSSSHNHPTITVSSPSSASSSGASSLLQSQSPFGTSFPPSSLKSRSQCQSPIVSTHLKSKKKSTHMN
ncbi:unnamed protein product [Ambrosiozyma monospora]|uniref:Unnamed protein product n=1 Tax=Ambrosiozyma monospora TaxID=43982 RepID=A0A9W6T2I6_AMBMO|nr:unnamed protein product [Ambrosiozyma monospora]